MNSAVIAYNNVDPVLGGFFTKCANKVTLACQSNGQAITTISPPEMTETNVIGQMTDCDVCFIAAHGDRDGIVDEDDNYVISTTTTNYNFDGKILYTVSCYSAINLKDKLIGVGLKAFIGYDDEFKVGDVDDEDVFVDCAVSGFEELSSGASVSEAKSTMMDKYNQEINRLSSEYSSPNSFFNASLLLNNLEHLCFEGQ